MGGGGGTTTGTQLPRAGPRPPPSPKGRLTAHPSPYGLAPPPPPRFSPHGSAGPRRPGPAPPLPHRPPGSPRPPSSAGCRCWSPAMSTWRRRRRPRSAPLSRRKSSAPLRLDPGRRRETEVTPLPLATRRGRARRRDNVRGTYRGRRTL